MRIYDSHVHSENSPDGRHAVTFLTEKAAADNFYGLCITDHCELDCFERDGYAVSVKQSYFDAVKAKKAFEGKLVLGAGVELGQILSDPLTANALLDTYNFDFVIASVHKLKGYEDFAFWNYEGADIDYFLHKYFDELAETIAFGRFDTLAHLTYPLRYIKEATGQDIDLSLYRKEIGIVLTELVKAEKALEINTSGLRQPIGQTLPTADIVSLFHQLGGRYITIGSDAHCTEDLGKGFDEGVAIAKQAGFTELTLIIRREPFFLPISDDELPLPQSLGNCLTN